MSESHEQEQDPLFTVLKWVAIAGVALWLAFEGYRHFAGMGPGDISYIDGSNLFEDGRYEQAIEYFNDALDENPQHTAALRGLANSYVQLQQYDEALTAIEAAIQLEPRFGGNYALRGIIYDHMGKHKQAMADYEKSLRMEPDVAKGMHWLDRLLYNVQETPPTVADRLAYLKAQMKLPESERVLRIPEIDRKQRPYER